MAAPQRRRINHWYIGETIGKGAFGFVKIGEHVDSGRLFAMKFIQKHENWDRRDTMQVQTELKCLTATKHPNVMRVVAYDFNCTYPNKDGSEMDTVLIVMPLCTGGALFDILYYTQSGLPEAMCRTYFKQLLAGLRELHKKGITHRDLKPQNLILDSNFVMKITDFGLSNVSADGQDARNTVMSSRVGTKGYQSPEIVMGRRYTNACDIFACGVILFVMATAYPPFETAGTDDRWYKYIATRRPQRFWEKHSDCEVESESFKDLIQRCITYQPRERITVSEALRHDWTSGEDMAMEEVKRSMEALHRATTERKREDANRNERLVPSEIVRDFDEEFEPPLKPDTWVFPFRGYTLNEDSSVREVMNSILWLFERINDSEIPHDQEQLTIDGQFDFENREDENGVLRAGGHFNVHVEIIKKVADGPNILILTPSGEAGSGKDWFLQTIFQEVSPFLDQPYKDEQTWDEDFEEDFAFECVDAFTEEEVAAEMGQE